MTTVWGGKKGAQVAQVRFFDIPRSVGLLVEYSQYRTHDSPVDKGSTWGPPRLDLQFLHLHSHFSGYSSIFVRISGWSGYLSMQSNRRFFVAATTDKSEASRIKKEAWHKLGLKMVKIMKPPSLFRMDQQYPPVI